MSAAHGMLASVLIGKLLNDKIWAMAGRKAKAGHEHFYVEPSKFVTAAIIISLFYLMPAAIFKPEWVPSALGPLNDILTYATINYYDASRVFFFICIMLHLFEAVFAVMICTYLDMSLSLSLKWGANVFVHGIFALRFLIGHLFETERITKEYNTVIRYEKIH